MKAFTLASSGNLISPKGRISYVNLLQPNPKAKTKAGKPKYTVSILLPPDCDFSLAKTAALDAATEEFGSKMNDPAFKKALRLPFLKAEEKGYGEEFTGWVVIRLTAINKPHIVDANGADVIEEQEVYSGRWARVSLNAFTYDVDGNRGVSFGINNMQLLDHADPLAGRARATDEFEPVASAVSTSKGANGLFDE